MKAIFSIIFLTGFIMCCCEGETAQQTLVITTSGLGVMAISAWLLAEIYGRAK